MDLKNQPIRKCSAINLKNGIKKQLLKEIPHQRPQDEKPVLTAETALELTFKQERTQNTDRSNIHVTGFETELQLLTSHDLIQTNEHPPNNKRITSKNKLNSCKAKQSVGEYLRTPEMEYHSTSQQSQQQQPHLRIQRSNYGLKIVKVGENQEYRSNSYHCSNKKRQPRNHSISQNNKQKINQNSRFVKLDEQNMQIRIRFTPNMFDRRGSGLSVAQVQAKVEEAMSRLFKQLSHQSPSTGDLKPKTFRGESFSASIEIKEQKYKRLQQN